MARVTAADEIYTRGGMLIARAGEVGEAVRDAVPADAGNCGRVFVRWGGRRHGYWVDRDDVRFLKAVNVSHYVARPAAKEDNGDEEVPPLPSGSFSYDYDFGLNLRLIRRARRLSQGALCRRMGENGLPLAQSTISYRESNPQAPGREFLRAAARALEVPPFIFLFPVAQLEEYQRAKKFLLMMSSAMAGG